MISAMVITLRTAQASPITAAACAPVPALDTITTRSADAISSTSALVRPARSPSQACIDQLSSALAELASGASGQLGDSLVRAPDTRPEPGSSARAGVPSNLIEVKKVARCQGACATRLTTRSLASSSAITLTARGWELG